MHVAIGSTGMEQGLAFYQLRKLLRVLEIFNKAKSPNCSYSTLHTFTCRHTMKTNKKQYTNHLKQK
jgi:hypothetical protein